MEDLLNETRCCDAKKMVQSSRVSSLAYINEKGGAAAVAEKREAYYQGLRKVSLGSRNVA
jgi:hypothetical protein